jgi:signal transduction histidine kinase
MLGDADLPPEAHGMATVIERNARRMAVMINDLLGAASIMTGELRIVRRWTDLAGLVRTAIDAIQPAAQAGQVVVTSSGPDSIVARVDEHRVMQVLDNLLSNAVKYCPDGGKVGVDCVVHDETITITVTDTGIGIPPEEQDHLFDRYFRASTAVCHGIAGTGLGLANAKAFAEAHGGTLTCASEPGTGSSFTLTLPDDPLNR